MKSSTIRRSNLSKEKMAVLEALSKYNNANDSVSNSVSDYAMNNEPIEDGSPEVYVRPSKEKELDLLWKDFRIPKGERSPIVYLGMGFVAGIVATLLVSGLISMSSGDFHIKSSENVSTEIVAPVEGESSEVTTSETSETVSNEEETPAPAQTKRFGFFGSNKASSSESSSESSTASQANKEYEVQSGDTMEKIVKSFYGSYSTEKVDAIVKANNMKDANKLSIGQKLIIPAEGIVENSAE